MAKVGKKNRQQNHAKKKASPVAVASSVCSESPSQSVDSADVQENKGPVAQVLMGVIDGELFDKIFKPAFIAFEERHDDEPLRTLVESIVTAIATRSVYEGCRRLDDVLQRYLYYLESLQSEPLAEREQSQALCDYWRSQVFMTLVRDARIVFELLFPYEPVGAVHTTQVLRQPLLKGIEHVLCCKIGGPVGDVPRKDCVCLPLYDFTRGISFPWNGFTPKWLFGLTHWLPDNAPDIPIEHEYAMLMPEQVELMRDALHDAIWETMLIDLVMAQHNKLYNEILSAFDEDMRLPDPILECVSQRVKFDKTYQAAFDAWLSGQCVSKPLHRSSRISIEEMNAVGSLYSILNSASQLGLGVYIFHHYA